MTNMQIISFVLIIVSVALILVSIAHYQETQFMRDRKRRNQFRKRFDNEG